MPASREELGPYRITRKIAVGGMAEIYLARHRGLEGLERTVVLKRILEKHERNEEFVTMFLDEARLMAALSHPSIAQVFDLGRTGDTHYLVMEYVRGPTLQALLGAARKSGLAGLPEKHALGIAVRIAEALHYVHERRDDLGRPLGIVHRDLNPANVVVSYDGAVKLIDFGIAKAATKVYETRTGVIKGTYGYIAPEALTGTAPVDHRADVFALGILLYEMLVGRHPFDASREPDLLDRIVEARYQRPREVRPSIPATLDRLVARCLAPHPEGRPESVRHLLEDLAAHMGERGIVPTEPDLAALARTLVPDEEGPQPLRRPASVSPRPLLPREARGSVSSAPPPDGTPTRPAVPAVGSPVIPEGTPDATPPPTAAPRERSDCTRKVGLVRSDERAPTAAPEPEVSSVSLDRRERDEPTASVPSPGDEAPHVLVPALVSEAPPPPTPGPTRGEESPAPLDEPSAATPSSTDGLPTSDEAPSAAASPSETTLRLLASASAPSPARRLLVVLGLAAAVALAFLAFLAPRLLVPEPVEEARVVPPPAAPTRATDAEVLATRALHIVSEPPGAHVLVNGVDVAARTPAVLAVDPRLPAVLLHVSLEGYEARTRRVSSTIGEVRFVLAERPRDSSAGPEGSRLETERRRAERPARRRGARRAR